MPDYRSQDVGDVLDRVLAEERKPKAKKPDVPLSRQQIDTHYDDLYLGYIKKLTEIHRNLKDSNRKAANPNWSEFRSLKQSEVTVMNAVRFHELYFSNLAQSVKMPSYINEHLVNSFKKKTTWEEDFLACGLSAKGWVILGYDRIDKKLINVTSDAHDIYVVNVDPLLVMDTYEHSYYIDFGSSKGKYIEFFLNNINWDIVASRLAEVEIE